MSNRLLPYLMVCVSLSCVSDAQVLSLSTSTNRMGIPISVDAIETAQVDFNLLTINGRNSDSTPLETPNGSVSKLDLKAPWKARGEYHKGYQLLMRKDWPGALEHLAKATAIYPTFVAAHNALGSAYLNVQKNEEAENEFAAAVALDDHLPNSYLNLGCAQLALKQYPAAEESFRKASSIAPLDLHLQTALAYAQFVNGDYPAVLETARRVHERKHQGAAIVHFFAAGAWEAEGNLNEAQREMGVLLNEDPTSTSAGRFRQILEQIRTKQVSGANITEHPPQLAQPVTLSVSQGPEGAREQARSVLQDLNERKQIAEAEAADYSCVDCDAGRGLEAPSTLRAGLTGGQSENKFKATIFRASTDEVRLVFAATDHGKSVADLAVSDIRVRDNNLPPEVILGFRNESQLPLRLGLVIDTSDSVTGRLDFEEAAATNFLRKVATRQDDLAFAVGVNNSVLLVQDFTADQTQTSRAIKQLAAGGGTALWDAVAFAAEKLGSRSEPQPVARALVVISDGKDNSSSVTLKQAIAAAQRGEVAVYTVSTRDVSDEWDSDFPGDHALRTLSELTGGAAFIPGSANRLQESFSELQQVLRARYFVSYKPASFRRDGSYRPIHIAAEKDGHKLRVFARKGYYALGPQEAASAKR